MIPVWDFFGKITYQTEEPGKAVQDPEMTEDYLGQSFLTINAIDGSIIDRSAGY